jgi:hypothetical protein
MQEWGNDFPLLAAPFRMQGFTATFQKTSFAPGEWQAQLLAPEPPFVTLSVADLLPEGQRGAYEAAGGELF